MVTDTPQIPPLSRGALAAVPLTPCPRPTLYTELRAVLSPTPRTAPELVELVTARGVPASVSVVLSALRTLVLTRHAERVPHRVRGRRMTAWIAAPDQETEP